MAEETNEGVAYLRALRQAANSQTASTPAPAREESPDSCKHSERRRHPRYPCEGGVELCEDGCDVRTFATFTDISMGGCYIEAQATYPIGTVLHLKLQANGFKMETKGSVRVNYPYLGMGVAFEEMSEENRARLRELMGSLARPCGIMGPGIVSSIPDAGPLEELPAVSNPQAAVRALVEFFESHHTLMREDFLRVLRASQSASATP